MTSGHGPEMSLAERLKALRHSGLSRALTQREVAAALGGDKPLSLALISSWETGKALPTEERLRDYARVFTTPGDGDDEEGRDAAPAVGRRGGGMGDLGGLDDRGVVHDALLGAAVASS